jgi:hypothetical protein
MELMSTGSYLRWCRVASVVTIFLGGCGPQTDLVAGSDPASGSGVAATMVAWAALVDPAPGTTGVPLNLAAVSVRFSTEVTFSRAGLKIVGAGQRASSGLPAGATCPDAGPGACFRIPLTGLLLPATTYLVTIDAGVVDATGQSISSGPVGQFATASEADLSPPAIAALTVEPSGPCVLVGFQTDEPAAATLLIRGNQAGRDVPAGSGVTTFSVAAPVASFGAGAEVQIVARVVDLAGNVAESASVAVRVPATLLPVAITEIHANPAGPEPAQEYVEIRNLDHAALDLEGLLLEDSKGADILPASKLDGGGYALIVPAAFDATNMADRSPRAGTPFIRVDARLGSDGLSNGGEVVRLRASDGTLMSSYSAAIDVSTSKWSGKSIHRLSEDACDQPANWTHLPASATPGAGAP